MSENTTPEVSIVVPIYNSAEFLPKCLNTLTNQSLKNIEIILVNDGSPDDSGVICDAFALRDKRIKVLHKENEGATSALNKGTYSATGKYIMYLDADDWIEPETCKVALSSANEHDADVVLWSYIKEFSDKSVKETPIFDQNRVFKGKDVLWLRRRIIGLLGPELKSPTRTDAINAGWGKIYRRTLIVDNMVEWTDTREVGSSDVLFNIQLYKHVSCAVFIPEFFNHYNQVNPHSLTKNYKFTLFSKYLNLFAHIEAFIKENRLSKEFEVAFRNRVAMSLINNSLSITSPNFSATKNQRIQKLQEILNNSLYRRALAELKLSYLPLHWKLFFVFCKSRFAIGVYSIALVMRRLRG